MANLNGINLADKLVPFTDDDNYPLMEDKYIQGGYQTVNSITERNNIPVERRKIGMFVFVNGVGGFRLTGGLANTNWIPEATATGGSENVMMRFDVVDGHLMLYTNSTSEASRFSIDENGHLIYAFV